MPAAHARESGLPRTDGSAPGTGDLLELIGLDDVALLEVLEVGEPNAALEAGRHRARVVLEPLERLDRAVPDDDALAQEPHARAARDDAVGDVATRDLPDAR